MADKPTLTINQDGKPLTETLEGVTMPADYTFACVNEYVNGLDVQFEWLQALCLGMATHIEKLTNLSSDVVYEVGKGWMTDGMPPLGTKLYSEPQSDRVAELKCPQCDGIADNGQPEGNTNPDYVYMCNRCCALEDVQKLQAQLTKIQNYISADAHAIQFQSIGQYRQALLKLLREETA